MDSMERAARLVEEYRSFRNGEALVPLEGWTVIHLMGADTAAFLQGLASQDLGPGSSRRTYFLTEKGRPLALGWVRVGEDGASAWVVADEGARESLLPHFERFRIMEEVEFRDAGAGLEVLGVAAATTTTLVPRSGADPADLVRIHADPLSILLVPSPSVAGPRADPAVFEPWRIEAGLPRTGTDFDLDRIVTELNDPEAVSLTKGCYVGQEVVARTSNRGQVRRRRVVFRFESSSGQLSPRAEIRAGDAAVGFLTSSAPVPGAATEGVGMGYVSTDALAQGSDLYMVQGPTTIPIVLVPSRGTALT